MNTIQKTPIWSILLLILGVLPLSVISQISVTSTTWTAGWGPSGGPEPAGLDTAILPISPQRFGSITIGDIDGDGDKDFISGGNRGQFYYYQNQGTPTSPAWVISTGTIPTLDSIHLGYNQTTNEVRPRLTDFDSDGDLDLIVGSRWNYEGFHKLYDLYFFRNIGSPTNPIFKHDTLSTLAIDPQNPGSLLQLGEFSSPGMVDLDGDGDLDMVSGGSDSCIYLENVGTPTNPSFVRTRGINNPFDLINGNGTSWIELSFLAPTVDFEDFDDDGDFDMYFMNEAGFIRYIPNNGTSTVPDFSPFISYPAHSFDTIDFGAFGAMEFEDVNGDGVKDLMASHWNPTQWYWYKGVSNGPLASITNVNVSCSGLSDGEITINSTSGGTSPYTYLWSTGSTDTSLTSLSYGSYTVTITDALSATSSQTVIITQPDGLAAFVVIDSTASCFGYSNGGASASATGGTTPYTYAWSNSATTASITGVSAGTYTVTITDNNGCTSTYFRTVTQTLPLVTTNVVDSNSTGGLANGGITASTTGGTTPYSYAWSNAATTTSITGLAVGTYTVTTTDQNGCSTTASSTITSIITTISVDSNVSCNTLSDGGATASATGGTAPYSYTWSNGATTASITGVVAGNYMVTVTDNNGSTSVKAKTITEPMGLVATSVVDSNTTCNGFANGGASASATGGTTPYNYAWSNSATTASITGIVAGNYSVTITDANGCTSTNSSVITEPALLIAATVTDSNVTCNGFANGGATTSATGGTAPYTYAWSNSATTASITGIMAGTYSVTTTDANGCTSASSTTITESSILVAASVVDSNVACYNFANGGATASATGGTTPYSYAWSNSATTASVTGIVAGNYSVTITDANGCTATSSSTITEPSILMAASVVDSNVTCNSLTNGGATVSASGGTAPYSYAWSNSATTASVTGIVAGNYSVTITDANGCTATSFSTITEPANLVGTTVVDSNITCNGFTNGGVTTSTTGGTAPYSYAWNNSATTASITGIVAGTYTVTITDANGCTTTSSSTITEPAELALSFTIHSGVTCNGANDAVVSYIISGGTAPYYNIFSAPDTMPAMASDTIGSISFPQYVIYDANGCYDTTSITITEPSVLVSASVVDSNVTCNGLSNGGATVSASGGTAPYSYAWSNSATTASVTGIVAGNYSVTITDANGCTATSSSTITEPASLMATTVVDSNITCNGFANGGATASTTGGTAPYSYAWSNSATTTSITGIVAGNYSVSITDANGCTTTSSSTITEPAELALNFTIHSGITCNGANDAVVSYIISGGTAPYYNMFSAPDTMPTMASDTIGPISFPQYVIYDVNGCYDTTSITITEPSVLVSASVVDSNVTCNSFANGGATVSASGGTAPYSYAWSNSATTASVTGIVAGNYSVTITDANGCTATSSSTITEPASLMATTVVDSNITCNGFANGGVTASNTGGTTPYSYAWSNSATTTSITGIVAGNYSVTITDANGCTATSSAITTEPAILAVNTMVDSNVTCFDGADGGLTLSSSGGTTPYIYLWSNGLNTPSISNLVAGTYSVTVTDSNGCSFSSSSSITQPAQIVVNLGNDTSICLNESLALDAGAGYASYVWQDTSMNQILNVDSSIPSASNYHVTVTNNDGCLGIDTINVTIFNIGEVTISGENDLCAYEVDTLIASSGFDFYEWNISETNSQLVIDANNLSAGNQTYSVLATDSNGCFANDTVSFHVFSPVIVNLGSDTSLIWVQGHVDTFTLDAGSGFNSYLWNDSSTSQTFDVTLANMGIISVLVQDGNGCFGSDTVEVDFILGTPNLEKTVVKIYPNPASNYLYIETDKFENQNISIILTDITGKVIYNQTKRVNGKQTSTIDVSQFATGTYFIQISNNQQKVVKSIVIN